MTAELEAIFAVSTRIREYEAAADTLKCLARLATDLQVRSVLGTQALELIQTAGKWRLEQDQEFDREERGRVRATLGGELVGLVKPAEEPPHSAAAYRPLSASESVARCPPTAAEVIAAEVRRQVGSCGIVFGSGQRCARDPDHAGPHNSQPFAGKLPAVTTK